MAAHDLLPPAAAGDDMTTAPVAELAPPPPFATPISAASRCALLGRDDPASVSAALADQATVVLQAAQIGGAPAKLAAIVNGSARTIGNLTACRDTLAQVSAYAATMQSDLGPTRRRARSSTASSSATRCCGR